ncbi:MAG TPA: hypothetical protein VFS05_12045, partial [Gemmatimonadaceae bacterium]|nr:hypothetical protein [Gemmatimonadaceae bacterium]
MTELVGVLEAFRASTACDAAVWVQDGEPPPHLEAYAAASRPDWVPPIGSGPPVRVDRPGGSALVAVVPGPRRAWLAIGPCATPDVRLEQFLAFLLPVVSQYLQSALEVEHAANELAERYEEINLLYT